MVAIITTEERELLKNQFIYDNVRFNIDVYDINDNCIIDEVEVNQCSIQWLKDKPLTEYLPKEESLY